MQGDGGISGAFGELQTAGGSLRLSGHTRKGPLTAEVEESRQGSDRTLIVHARTGPDDWYRATFSHDNDRLVFQHLRDSNGHTTTLVLADTEDPDVGSVTIWHDANAPEHFRVSIPRFVESRYRGDSDISASILDEKAFQLDLVGRRNPVDINGAELYELFGETPAYKQFMRGQDPDIAQAVKPELAAQAIPQGGVNWKCAWICLVPACGLSCLFWDPAPKNQPEVVV